MKDKKRKGFNIITDNFYISIRKKEDCYFSRRNGYRGKILFGYSICLRVFKRVVI